MFCVDRARRFLDRCRHASRAPDLGRSALEGSGGAADEADSS